MGTIHEACVQTLRFLAADEVEKAKSGHPGFPLGTAPLIYTFWDKFMRYNPADPKWFNRDRFVLSPGHGSALLYAMLHLAGYDLSLDDLKDFRQWGSRTPGHPEYGVTPGVDVSTGPLGHGFAMGVGFALAETMLAAKYNKPEYNVIDHYTYGIVSDGDLMEGVASEAASLAGTMGLGKLIYMYDDNKITIEGETTIAFTEDVETRFKAYGWQVLRVDSSENLDGLEAAVKEAQADTDHPSLIIVRTHIGFGSPKQDSPSAHGEPLGTDALKATKEKAGWDPEASFVVPEEVKEHFAAKLPDCAKAEADWNELLKEYGKAYPELVTELLAALSGNRTIDLAVLEALFEGKTSVATRAASGDVMQKLAELAPELAGGSADLGPSNKTVLKACGYYSREDRSVRNIHFGVREHAMGCVLNGMSLHGGIIPYGATFLVFSDFLRPSVRMAALMEIQSVFVLTHDSIAVGEDGPTHQPIEQVTSLRMIPNTTVFRPADALETAAAWKFAVEHKNGPTALCLSRQNLPVLHEYAEAVHEGALKGGYVLSPAKDMAKAVVIATGSEVAVALEAQKLLAEEGIDIAVVSMPSVEVFEQQSDAYKESVLPKYVPTFAVEAGVTLGWTKYTGREDRILGINRFGASAPGGVVMEHYGLTGKNVASMVKAAF
ncbi:MAG: transketolase [Acidaminococcaceae bacterium]|nr:transketolase [Acidaminococcaceae bacterium]